MPHFEVVLVDLETTSLNVRRTEICQISAFNRGRILDLYMVPLNGISSGATQVHGLTTRGGELFLNGQELQTIPVKAALNQFLEFLASRRGKYIILAAHNGRRFDFPIIERYMRDYGLWDEYYQVVDKYVDTIDVFRNCGSCLLSNNQSFSQYNLVEKLLGEEMCEGAHDAAKDVENLRNLLRHLDISWKEVVHHAYNL